MSRAGLSLADSASSRIAARVSAPPRIALRVEEAAASLGLSADAFREHVAGELRWIRRGRLKLVTVRELERWCERASARTLEDAR